MTRPWLSSISPNIIFRGSWSRKGFPLAARNTRPQASKQPSPDRRTMPMAVGEWPVAMAAIGSINIQLLDDENRDTRERSANESGWKNGLFPVVAR